MLEFPKISAVDEPQVRKMSLLEYAHFSEMCLRMNTHITPENCMEKRAREKSIPRPFSLSR